MFSFKTLRIFFVVALMAIAQNSTSQASIWQQIMSVLPGAAPNVIIEPAISSQLDNISTKHLKAVAKSERHTILKKIMYSRVSLDSTLANGGSTRYYVAAYNIYLTVDNKKPARMVSHLLTKQEVIGYTDYGPIYTSLKLVQSSSTFATNDESAYKDIDKYLKIYVGWIKERVYLSQLEKK